MAGVMRRALIVALAGLAIPASVLAQSAGAISVPAGFTSINIAQCNGAQNAILSDELTVDLSWTVNPGTIPFSGGTLNLYALKVQPGAGQTTTGTSTISTSCTTTVSGGAISPANPVPDSSGTLNIVPTGQTMSDSFSLSQFVAKAGLDCTLGSTSTVYLCIQWASSGNATAGFATAQVKLDTTAPAKPGKVSASSGDGTLHLSASVDSTATSCKAVATSTADSGTHTSGEDACDSLTIKSLQNGVDYQVVVYAINAANNPSKPSDPVTATPFPTDDFWNLYKGDNGRESGGCSTAAGGAGLLLTLLGLLAVRRRKP
jgi:MYXO-CTERM domain-containing protein